MNILLAYRSHPEGARDPFTSLLPVGLLYLNAVLANLGHRVTLANLSGVPWKRVRTLLKELRPQVLGISQFTHNRADSLELARVAKELDAGCRVVLGGPHATHTCKETLAGAPFVDAIVLGEGEETFAELLKPLVSGGDLSGIAGIAYRSRGKIVATAHRLPIPKLDLLPMPARHLERSFNVDPRRQLEFVITSRGCPASCHFCSSPLFWGRSLRFRSPRAIVDEIRYLRERYGLVYFSFRDDTFTANRERVLEFCRLLGEERVGIFWNCQSRVNAVDEEMLIAMKRAGCECIQFGVESGSPELLKALGKRITVPQVEKAAAAVRRVGINLSVYLITGIEGEGEPQLKETLALVEKMRAHDGQVSPLVYYPGTRLFADAAGRGEVDASLFARADGEGFLVRHDPFVEKARKSLLAGLRRAGERGRYTREDFQRQRALVGYAPVTEMLWGETLEGEEAYEEALKVYREMMRREPDHPWGHLLYAGLAARLGMVGQAKKAYLELARLVPQHLPAWLALGELALMSGDRAGARSSYEKALELDPADAAAQEGLAALGPGSGPPRGRRT
ncbi:B12-binding domain-containing radical SAM protein [Geomesophilobacter sediminis]|uniref:Radical SAM protein n=1 Tax=Geomesophilobacter sediminis TaxID=2798584 RepID=A0A8J7J4N8_9BACT|nr:radical SAM protein [Geomesophilobacter sediminis]MBJ6725893.1 radical SAM protein [Geomesophilobacter sediminis]